MQDGSRLSPIDATDDCQGPAIGMTHLSPDIRMTMGDVAPIICDDPADDDGPLSGFSVSLFAEEALDSLRDDARSQTLNTFSLDKNEIFEELMPVMPLQRLPTPPPCDPAVSAPRAEMPKRGRAAAAAPRGASAAGRSPAAASGHRAAAAGRRPAARQLFGRELRQRQRHHAAQGARRAAAREQGDGRRGRRV
ncbi:hypothetical protein M885DRAFT_552571 [Pelagophyceae sp. CCMP2097]|nr:hypothetical protein M885DRAFT_552571 [Pelagophyceae sp. CCMP2097]